MNLHAHQRSTHSVDYGLTSLASRYNPQWMMQLKYCPDHLFQQIIVERVMAAFRVHILDSTLYSVDSRHSARSSTRHVLNRWLLAHVMILRRRSRWQRRPLGESIFVVSKYPPAEGKIRTRERHARNSAIGPPSTLVVAVDVVDYSLPLFCHCWCHWRPRLWRSSAAVVASWCDGGPTTTMSELCPYPYHRM